MRVRDLLELITDHAADARHLNDKVILKVGREYRTVTASYTDGTLLLIAGPPIRR